MHGTGTALGDPIEMNAALKALLGSGNRAPLQFSAHKASCGHAEPSAGRTAHRLHASRCASNFGFVAVTLSCITSLRIVSFRCMPKTYLPLQGQTG